VHTGQIVTVKLYGGKTAQRRVVAIKGDVIVVCAEQEFQAALRENRQPSGLGFPVEDVVNPEISKKGAASETPVEYHGSKAGD
jgi:hypothetical protein